MTTVKFTEIRKEKDMKAKDMKPVGGVLLAGCLAVLAARAERVELFNGKDLSGWTSVVDH